MKGPEVGDALSFIKKASEVTEALEAAVMALTSSPFSDESLETEIKNKVRSVAEQVHHLRETLTGE